MRWLRDLTYVECQRCKLVAEVAHLALERNIQFHGKHDHETNTLTIEIGPDTDVA